MGGREQAQKAAGALCFWAGLYEGLASGHDRHCYYLEVSRMSRPMVLGRLFPWPGSACPMVAARPLPFPSLSLSLSP